MDVIFNTTVGHTVSQVILDMEPAVTNRCRWDILYDVVSAARYAAKKTHIMNSANVPYQTLVEYLNHATEKGLLEEEITNEYEVMYVITRKGLQFIVEYDNLTALMSVCQLRSGDLT